MGVELDGANQKVIIDADSDTYLQASTDDTLDIYIAGAKDFTLTANTLTAQSGSTIAAQALTATTIGATGVVSISDGTAGAPALTNTGDTNCGLYFSAADTLSFTAAGTAQFTMADGVVAPVTDNDVDLGTSSLEFKDGYFDGTLYCDTLNLAGTSHTAISGGLTVADCWRLTTEFSGDADPIASNLEQVDETEEGTIGSAMTESSGIFTFPSTGIYLVSFGAAFSMAGSSRYNHMEIQVTSDNSSYAIRGYGSQQVVNDGSSYSQGFIQNLIDVTNTTNVKVKFKINVEDSGCTTRGNSNSNSTFMMFLRLGDT